MPLRKFCGTTAVLLLVFGVPLYRLVQLSFARDLYSFTVLVPFISAYLVWIERERLSSSPSENSGRKLGYCFLAFGALFLGAGFFFPSTGSVQGHLALWIYSLVSFIIASACFLLNANNLRVVAFPLGFLIFLAPFPLPVEEAMESWLQYSSAFTAQVFFQLSGMPSYRDGTFFQLPGFNMQVAPECSGIRSTLALFLTSLVAGQLFLKSWPRRVALALVVIPLAVVRNGFRVFVIGELCVRISPDMIDSWIHRRGGPVFFALSLIPFIAILAWLYRSERRVKNTEENLRRT